MSTFIPPQFNDIGKKAKDLFSKKYNFNNSLIVKHRNKASKDCSMVIETKGNVSGCGSVYGETKVTCESKRGTAHKLEVEASTCGPVKAKLELTDLAPSLTVEFNGDCCAPSACGDKKACDTKAACPSSCLANLGGGVKAKYDRDSFAGSVGVCHKNKTYVSASAVVGSNGLSAGGSISADAVAGTVGCYAVGLEYSHADIVLSLVSNKFRSHTVTAYHPVNKDTKVGFQFEYNPDSKCASKQRVLSAGVEYAAAPDTVVKAKASSGGCAALNVEHRLGNPNVLLAFSAGFQLTAPKSGGACTTAGACSPDKFGVQLTFGDF
jgi:hypothetical protein